MVTNLTSNPPLITFGDEYLDVLEQVLAPDPAFDCFANNKFEEFTALNPGKNEPSFSGTCAPENSEPQAPLVLASGPASETPEDMNRHTFHAVQDSIASSITLRDCTHQNVSKSKDSNILISIPQNHCSAKISGSESSQDRVSQKFNSQLDGSLLEEASFPLTGSHVPPSFPVTTITPSKDRKPSDQHASRPKISVLHSGGVTLERFLSLRDSFGSRTLKNDTLEILSRSDPTVTERSVKLNENYVSVMHQHTNSNVQVQRRKYKVAKPSQYCHICARHSRMTAMIPCDNIKRKSCQKSVCLKCICQYSLFEGAGPWICPHCRDICPNRARCHVYNFQSLRRRIRSSYLKSQKE